ncbi:MAG: gliding motility lipoprotein GldH [Flavobacteriaceae bacterium]|nr:gliding motility lipoprotein GldH [Flavobacteriaceae bacterium]
MKMLRIFCACSIFLLGGCIGSSGFLEFYEMPNGWNKNETVTFSFTAPDYPSKNNVFLYLHTDHKYPFSNLFVITDFVHPDRQVQTDTLQFEMTSPDGSSLGTGWMDVKEHKLWCYENISLDPKKKYTFRVRQAMRMSHDPQSIENLKGILDIGLGIEPVE